MVKRQLEWSAMDTVGLSGKLPLINWDDYLMGVFPKFKKALSLWDYY